jgi:hypothetical protein
MCFGPLMAIADDAADVRKVVDQYVSTEGSDLAAQQKLMTSDSIFVNQGRRQTDQAHNAMIQIAISDAFGTFDPNSKTYATAGDVIVRVYGNSAIASFYRYWDFVPSQELLAATDGDGPTPFPPQIVTLVLVKQGGAWKIALRHTSPLHPSN